MSILSHRLLWLDDNKSSTKLQVVNGFDSSRMPSRLLSTYTHTKMQIHQNRTRGKSRTSTSLPTLATLVGGICEDRKTVLHTSFLKSSLCFKNQSMRFLKPGSLSTYSSSITRHAYNGIRPTIDLTRSLHSRFSSNLYEAETVIIYNYLLSIYHKF